MANTVMQDAPLARSEVPTFSQIDAFEITYLRHVAKRLVATVLPLMQEKENGENGMVSPDAIKHLRDHLEAGDLCKGCAGYLDQIERFTSAVSVAEHQEGSRG